MSAQPQQKKLFYGLFIFPLLIAAGMALILSTIVFLTYEDQSPETLISDIKSGTQSKRWQKAYELSNELNNNPNLVRNEALINEMVHIAINANTYDAKTRAYIALALRHFPDSDASQKALVNLLTDPDPTVRAYSTWSLGSIGSNKVVSDIRLLLNDEESDVRKVAAYVLGVLNDQKSEKQLTALLKDSVADVRWNAALSLAQLGSLRGRNILITMLDRDNLSANHELSEAEIERVMINATRGLALIGDQDAVEVLRRISQTEKSLKVRQAAFEAIQK